MNLDKTIQYLTLAANVGVLIGIGFLVLEIDQANRIADREARSELITQYNDLQMSILENVDLAKSYV